MDETTAKCPVNGNTCIVQLTVLATRWISCVLPSEIWLLLGDLWNVPSTCTMCRGRSPTQERHQHGRH